MTAKPWPAKYEFPVYAVSHGIVQMLNEGEKLDHERERSDVLGALYQDATKYTL